MRLHQSSRNPRRRRKRREPKQRRRPREAMPPPYPSSCSKPRSGTKPTSCLSAVATTPTKKIARPASAPNRMAVHAARSPHQPSTPKQSAALPHQAAAFGQKAPAAARQHESEFMAPRDAKTVHPARRLAPGTAVCVRTRLMMITEKCCLVVWLPARVVSASGAYHCTVKYSGDLSPAFAGKMVRKPVDHVRVVAPQRAAVKPESRNMAPAPERNGCSTPNLG